MAEIREDSLVRYRGTGTIGTVKVLKVEDDGETWAFLDSTGLYYRLDTLELIEKPPERKELEGMTIEQMMNAFNGGKFRNLYYFPYMYFCLKVLEYQDKITYFGRGGIVRKT